MYNQILFTNILRVLEELGMTKNDLAQKAGVSLSFLSDLTNGKANPSLRVMEAIATALDVPLTTLLDSTDLDEEALDILTEGKKHLVMPQGFVRLTLVLTKFQAFTASQWDIQNRRQLRNTSTATIQPAKP